MRNRFTAYFRIDIVKELIKLYIYDQKIIIWDLFNNIFYRFFIKFNIKSPSEIEQSLIFYFILDKF